MSIFGSSFGVLAGDANNTSSSGGGSLFKSITSGLSNLATAVSAGVGSWAAIKSRKQDIALQQAQVQAEIARINAQKNIAISNAQQQAAAQQAAAQSVGFTPSRGAAPGFLSSIPPWMLIAGVVGGLFIMRGVVK